MTLASVLITTIAQSAKLFQVGWVFRALSCLEALSGARAALPHGPGCGGWARGFRISWEKRCRFKNQVEMMAKLPEVWDAGWSQEPLTRWSFYAF